MTPATYSMPHLLDRFAVMLCHLAGEPLPAPPPIPGRHFRPLPDPGGDALAEAWDAQHPDAEPMPPPSASELAAVLGVSREAARQRLERARRTGDVDAVLRPPRQRRGDGASDLPDVGRVDRA